MKIKIEKNIPVPDVYPILEMEVGDSFFVPCEAKKKEKKRGHINSAIHRRMVKHKLIRKHTTKSIEGGFRVWRLS